MSINNQYLADKISGKITSLHESEKPIIIKEVDNTIVGNEHLVNILNNTIEESIIIFDTLTITKTNNEILVKVIKPIKHKTAEQKAKNALANKKYRENLKIKQK